MLYYVFIVLVTKCHYIIFSWFMQIDEEILQEVVKMGFDRNQLLESLRNRVQNEVSFFTTHSLMICKYFSHGLYLVSGYCSILFAVG